MGAFASAPEAEASGSAFVVAAIHQVDSLDVIGFTLLEQKSVHDCAAPEGTGTAAPIKATTTNNFPMEFIIDSSSI